MNGEVRPERRANRIHCRETRLRKKDYERKLVEEAEALSIYRDLVEAGPDLFSCHSVTWDAPFTFVSDSFQEQLKVRQEEVLDLPLAIIVDPRDSGLLRTAVGRVLEDRERRTSGEGSGLQGGSLVNLRVGWGGLLFNASMTITVGTQGIIVVTRVYNALEAP